MSVGLDGSGEASMYIYRAVWGSMAADLTPSTVAERLRADDTRGNTLDALEAMPCPISTELSLATAPALVDVTVATQCWKDIDRCGLLFARLAAEAAPDPSSIYGAAFAGERLAAHTGTQRLIKDAMQRALAGEPLTRNEAYSIACREAYNAPIFVRGWSASYAAAGRTPTETLQIVR